jgi:hypothetical protein
MSKPLRVAVHDLVVSYLLTRLATDEHVDVAELTLATRWPLARLVRLRTRYSVAGSVG